MNEKKRLYRHSNIYNIAQLSLFLALLITSANIKIPLPFSPVPFSLQSLVVLIIGLMLEPFDSFKCITCYIILGLIGLPVFALGGGISYILQPSFGYIVGFLLAAPISGCISHQKSNMLLNMIALIVATFLITLSGIFYLWIINRFYLVNGKSFIDILKISCLFIPIDLGKIPIAYFFVKKLQSVLQVS